MRRFIIRKEKGKNISSKMVKQLEEEYTKQKERGNENPIDATIAENKKQMIEDLSPEELKSALIKMLETDGVPNRFFEKFATIISKDKDIEDSIIVDAINEAETITDKNVMHILEEADINQEERLKIIPNLDSNKLVQDRIENEYKILYKASKSLNDKELAERVEKIEKTLGNIDTTPEMEKLKIDLVAKKMAENCYSETFRGTRIYYLSKIVPATLMLEKNVPEKAVEEFKKIEQDEGKEKPWRISEEGLKNQILEEVKKQKIYSKDVDQSKEDQLMEKLQQLTISERNKAIDFFTQVLDEDPKALDILKSLNEKLIKKMKEKEEER